MLLASTSTYFNGQFNLDGPVPDWLCTVLRNPITQNAMIWEASSQCFQIPFTDQRACPSEFGIQATDAASFYAQGCVGAQQSMYAAPVVCLDGYKSIGTGCVPLEWYEKWQTWAIAGGGAAGILLLAALTK